MDLAHFVALSNAEQIKRVTIKGVRLCNRTDDEYKVTLYQIDAFYIEVHYHKIKKHITHLGAFSSMELLDPYLGEIDITGVL